MSLVDQAERDALEGLPGPGEPAVTREELRERTRLGAGQDVIILQRLLERNLVEQLTTGAGPLRRSWGYRLTDAGQRELEG